MTMRRCALIAGTCALVAYTIGNTLLLRSIDYR